MRNPQGTVVLYNKSNRQRLVYASTLPDFLGGIFTMYFEAIAKVIADRMGRDISEIKPESTFAELGIDSLDTVELLMSLEDEIGTEIELDQKVTTVGELDRFIQSKTQG